MSQACDREEQLKRVQQLGFMTDDLRLFLNTHPESQEALAALQRSLVMERTAVREYEKNYGSLTLEGVIDGCEYDWISHPWPWEMEE